MKIKLGDITPRMSNNICLNVDGDCGICPLGGSFVDTLHKTHYYCKLCDMPACEEVKIPEALLKGITRKVYTKQEEVK